MGVIVESLKSTTISGSYSTSDTAMNLASAVQNSTGYGVVDPGGSHEEIVYWGGKTGVQVTSMLRGLSKTALTNTEVAGNKKTHDDGETFVVTNVHYIINDKASKTSAETITAVWSFVGAVPTSDTAASSSTELMRYNETVRTTGDQTIADIKTFSSFPITPSSDPTTDYQTANKQYVDSRGAANTRFSTKYFGEAATKGQAISLETLDNTDGGSAGNFGRDAVSQGVKQAQSFIAGSTASSFSMTISLLKQGAPADNVYVTIEEDSAGDPSGTPVTNGTSNDVAAATITGAFSDISFTWASDPVLVAGTKYWFVLQRDGANSDVNYYQAEYGSNNAFRAGAAKVLQSAWTTNTGANDDLVFNISGVDGSAVLSKVETYNSRRGQLQHLGVAFDASTAIGAQGDILTEGLITGLSGLTENSKYYLSGTAGATSTTASLIQVGRAISSTELLVDRRRGLIEDNVDFRATNGDNYAADATATSLFGKFKMPTWATGADVSVSWISATTGDIVYNWGHIYGADGEAYTSVLVGNQTISNAGANYINEIALGSLSGVQADDWVSVFVQRDGAQAADTLTDDITFLGMNIIFY